METRGFVRLDEAISARDFDSVFFVALTINFFAVCYLKVSAGEFVSR